jgi:multiple sugar transport system permease protein
MHNRASALVVLGRRTGRPFAVRRSQPLVVGWSLAAPAVILLVGISIFPTVYLLYNSLFSGTLLGGNQQFVGLDNFVNVFSDKRILWNLLATIIFVFVAVALEMVIGILLAVPLAKRSRGNTTAFTLLLLPFALTPVVSALVWRQLLDPNFGWLDYYLQRLGLISAPVDWLSGTLSSWVVIIGVDVWQWTPFVALIMMAAFQGAPAEPREAAQLDGASAWQIFRYVTLPLVRPLIVVALMLRMIEAFKTFATIRVLTNGGPGNSTEIVNLAIFRVSLQSFEIGAAAALGIVFLALLGIVISTVLKAAVGKGNDMGMGF